MGIRSDDQDAYGFSDDEDSPFSSSGEVQSGSLMDFNSDFTPGPMGSNESDSAPLSAAEIEAKWGGQPAVLAKYDIDAYASGDFTARKGWEDEYAAARREADQWNNTILGSIAGFFGYEKEVNVAVHDPTIIGTWGFNSMTPVGTVLGGAFGAPMLGKAAGFIGEIAGAPDVRFASESDDVFFGSQFYEGDRAKDLVYNVGEGIGTGPGFGNLDIGADGKAIERAYEDLSEGGDSPTKKPRRLSSIAAANDDTSTDETEDEDDDLLTELNELFSYEFEPLTIPTFEPLAPPHGKHADFRRNRRNA